MDRQTDKRVDDLAYIEARILSLTNIHRRKASRVTSGSESAHLFSILFNPFQTFLIISNLFPFNQIEILFSFFNDFTIYADP